MQRNEDHPENRIFKSKIWKTHTKKSWKKKKKDTTANENSRERPAARAIREEEKKEDVDSN